MRVFIFLLFSISIGVCRGIEFNAAHTNVDSSPMLASGDKAKASDLFYQSNDGGKTWQDISFTLPENTDVQRIYNFGEAYYMISTKGDLYQTKNPLKNDWERETVLAIFNNIGTNEGEGIWRVLKLNSGIYATIYKKGFYKKVSKNVWMPMHEHLHEKIINSIVETADGCLAVSTPSGIYKSKDEGKTWQHILKQEWIANLCENNGILIACSTDGLIRSADNGEHWETVIADKGVSFGTSIVDGQFIAIREFDPERQKNVFAKPKCSFISPDAGKHWQCIDVLFSPVEGLYDLKKIENDLYCGNKIGIFRSKDNGTNWELVLPMKEDKEPWRLEVIPSEKTIFIAKVWAGC